jgi:precorrin-6B methylase 2
MPLRWRRPRRKRDSTLANGRDGGKTDTLRRVGVGEIRTTAARLSASTEALAALGAALRLRASGLEAPTEVQAGLDEVMDALGVGEAIRSSTPDELSAALAPIRALLLQSVDLLTDPSRAPGWAYTDAELLEGFGQSSAPFAKVVHDVLAPELPGLADALARPGAAFLDVGVGVGALSIAMCRLYPDLDAVGIDPWEVALDRARRNVAAAGLAERIALRPQRVEELDDEAAFDLVFLAGPFLGRNAVGPAYERSLAALRPGGWVLFAMFGGSGALELALARLRTARSGGAVLDAAEAEYRLGAAGFTGVRSLAAELGIPSQLVVGRRP